MLEAIRGALEQEEEIELVGVAHSGGEALTMMPRVNPDVVLLDVRMPLMDGFTALGHIRKRYSDVKVVMLSAIDDPEQIQAALRQGAASFILKHIDPRDLASAIRQASTGAVFQVFGADDTSDESVANEFGITSSELRVLRALVQRFSNKQIAKELSVTEQTVKFHLTSIYRKLEVSNRTEAARLAYQHGLATNPSYEIASQ